MGDDSNKADNRSENHKVQIYGYILSKANEDPWTSLSLDSKVHILTSAPGPDLEAKVSSYFKTLTSESEVKSSIQRSKL
ncbi:MAG: hypothetical protein MMC23_005190 [Stictis urceolatum]|nr:hypothetical protein [Stictis urceolata]